MTPRVLVRALFVLGLLEAAGMAEAQPPADAAKAKPKTAVAGPATRPAPKPAPRILEGVVKAPDGKPVENARVTYRNEDDVFGAPPVTLKTDAAGHFRVELKANTRLSVRIEAQGLGSRVLENVKPGPPITVTLDRGRTLEGTVRDAAGQPVPGARVVARASQWAGVSWDPTVGQATARTDAKGRYRLVGLEPALFTVSATLTGVGQAIRNNVRPIGSLDLVLGPTSGLVGEVVDADGRPVAGAVVRAEKPPFSEGDTDTTDAQGRFLMTALSPGNYHLAAKHPDFAPALSAEVVVAAASEAQVQVVLDPGTTVVGRVIDAAERPLAATVALERWGDLPATLSLAQALRTEAGADGRFRLERVAGGTYTFGVRAPRLGSKSVEVTASGRAGTVDLGDVVLEPGLAIRGHVRTTAGLPVPDARVTASLQQPMFSGVPNAEERTDAEGAFLVAGLAPGMYELVATASGFTTGRAKATAGAEAADLTVNVGGSLTGLVLEDGDRPVESFHVQAELQSGSERSWQNQKEKSVGSSDGRFLLEDLAEGAYTLRVLVPERAPASVSNAHVVPGRTTDVGVIRMLRGGVVRGVVVDATGGAVAGATVKVDTGAMDKLNWLGLMTAQTDAAGSFEVRGVPTGTVKVEASHPSFAAGGTTAEVDPGKAPVEVRIVLLQGGRIEGSVRKRDGQPVPGQTIWIMGPQVTSSDVAWPITGNDGTFTVEHVPAGPVQVWLMASMGQGQFTNALKRDVEVRDGETVSADFVSRDVLITGRVTRSGAALPGVALSLQAESMQMSLMISGGSAASSAPPTGPQRNRAVTREDGSFELLVGEPGRYRASVRAPASPTSFPNRLVEVPDVESFTVDLDYSGALVSGLVVAKDTHEPVAEARVSAQAHALADGKVDGVWGGTGRDGRFELVTAPGDYRLSAGAEDYIERSLEISVGETGVSDLLLELEHGREISGRVVNASGQGVAGIQVAGVAVLGPKERGRAYATTRGDGGFQLRGLNDAPHNLCATGELVGFAIRTGIRPGARDLTLTLQPGGSVRVLILEADGMPVKDSLPMVAKVNGSDMEVPLYAARPTDATGRAEMRAPVGTLELVVYTEKAKGRTTVTVTSGQVVEAEIRLTEPADQP